MLRIFRTGCEYLCKFIFCECNIKKVKAKHRTILPTKHYNKYYTLHILLIFAYILYVFYTSSNFPLTYKNLVYSYQCTRCYWNFKNSFYIPHTTHIQTFSTISTRLLSGDTVSRALHLYYGANWRDVAQRPL